jgi:hypothetical protein
MIDRASKASFYLYHEVAIHTRYTTEARLFMLYSTAWAIEPALSTRLA